MSVQSDIQKGVSDLSLIIGKGLMYGGGASLLVMAVIGTVSIDIVLLHYAEKTQNSFLTGYILGTMLWGPKVNPLPALMLSPITSLIAVGLSVALGVPGVGGAILAGWAFAATVLGLGYGLVALSEAIEPEDDYERRSSYSFA
ncbi:hypothetical protein [uncultured Legionella sp.]|uniref:hypothetical protein n=1 Tax=uncultured Legionella sp. TaxID=210934 RepID=UPI00260BA43B|nr:hypothetical protein [uncultured Legionella sp.]